MKMQKLRTAIIGFGKMGSGYADDPVMAPHYPYATHAQVLVDHPVFAWEAVVDVSDHALDQARNRWKILQTYRSLDELAKKYEPDVVVIATPPQERKKVIEKLPSLRAVLVEKPLGRTHAEAKSFIEVCNRRGILVQTNYWRRSDTLFRELANGKLLELIGAPQVVFGLYGNGVLNNGSHMIDLVRMLFGEVIAVQASGICKPYVAGPIESDINLSFSLRLSGGVVAEFNPVRFEHYRENGLDIWGERGRLAILQEGLGIAVHPQRANRAMRDEREIASDMPATLKSTVGDALYHIYSNLADAVHRGEALWSPGLSAMKTQEIVEYILRSYSQHGSVINLG